MSGGRKEGIKEGRVGLVGLEERRMVVWRSGCTVDRIVDRMVGWKEGRMMMSTQS